MASPPNPIDAQQITDQLFAILKSIDQFDEIEVRGIVRTIISPTERERCFKLVYHRCVADVASLKVLNNRQHFQAISMITRNLFELAVDLRLIDVIPNAIPKMIGFIDVEKLRCARKIIKFKAANPNAPVEDVIYRSYVAAEASRIDATKATLWPGIKRLDHWSDMSLKDRAAKLGPKYEEMYEVQQPRLSWQVHSGLTGIANLKMDTFTAMCGVAISISADCYQDILLSMIDEFKLSKANAKIRDQLQSAKLVPLARDQAEADMIYRHLTKD